MKIKSNQKMFPTSYSKMDMKIFGEVQKKLPNEYFCEKDNKLLIKMDKETIHLMDTIDAIINSGEFDED